jgi:hypothetical protein
MLRDLGASKGRLAAERDTKSIRCNRRRLPLSVDGSGLAAQDPASALASLALAETHHSQPRSALKICKAISSKL